MIENPGAAESQELFRAVLAKYPGRQALSESCNYSMSYLL